MAKKHTNRNKHSFIRWFLGLFLTSLLGIFIIRFALPSLYQDGKDLAGEALFIIRGVGVGREAPDFELLSLVGESFQLSSYRGQVVVVVFSTTWCPDCRAQLPLLSWLYENYPGIILLDVDTGETQTVVASTVEQFPSPYPILLDEDGSVAAKYLVSSYPTMFVIDQEGVIRSHLLGDTSQGELSRILDRVIERSEGGE